MNTESNTIKKELIKLRVIFSAMISGIILFTILAAYFSKTAMSENDNPDNLYIIVLLGLTIVILPAIFSFTRKSISNIDKNISLSEKLKRFSGFWIVRLAAIEGIILFSLVCLLLFGDNRFLYIAVLVVMFFSMNYPSTGKIVQMLRLSGEDAAKMQ